MGPANISVARGRSDTHTREARSQFVLVIELLVMAICECGLVTGAPSIAGGVTNIRSHGSLWRYRDRLDIEPSLGRWLSL